MGERLAPQPTPFIIGRLGSFDGRTTQFDLVFADSKNRVIQTDDKRLSRITSRFAVWNNKDNVLYFSSPKKSGVLVCKASMNDRKEIKISENGHDYVAYEQDSVVNLWFKRIFGIRSRKLRVVSKLVLE